MEVGTKVGYADAVLLSSTEQKRTFVIAKLLMLRYFAMMIRLIILAALILAAAPPAEGKIISGHLTTGSNFEFLDRFCFQPYEKGTLYYELKYKAESCCYKLLMFNDEPGQWPYVRANEDKLTCGQKKEVIPGTNNAKLTLKDSMSGCKQYTDSDGVEWIRCIGGRSFKTDRARWWYLVMSNCYSEDGIDIEYNITMTNGDQLWDKHFSADERYILETNMTFLFVYLAMVITTVYFTKILSERRLLHSTYKMFMVSLLAECSSLFFLTVAQGAYGSTGTPYPKLEIVGNLIGAFGNLVFILTILLLCKGFTVTRGRLSETSWVKLSSFMTLYAITYLTLYIYEETMFDPRDVLYKYESVAGYGLIGPYFIGFFWTSFAIYKSVQHHPEKISFYIPFGFIFTVWWLATPVTIFICNFAVDDWVRAKTVNGIERAVICGGHIFFLLLTRPSAANQNFPFHIKTSQIAADVNSMKGEDSKYAYSGTGPSMMMRDEYGQVVGLSFTDLFMTDPTPRDKLADTVIQIDPEEDEEDKAQKTTIITVKPAPLP